MNELHYNQDGTLSSFNDELNEIASLIKDFTNKNKALEEKLKAAVELLEKVKNERRVAIYMIDGKTIGTLGEASREVLSKIKAT